MAWYHDKEGDLWKHSKTAGGVQVEDRDTGEFGEVIRLAEAISDYELESVPYEVGLVLDEFEKIRIPQIDLKRFRTLRAAVVKIVEHARTVVPPTQIAGGTEERKTEVTTA